MIINSCRTLKMLFLGKKELPATTPTFLKHHPSFRRFLKPGFCSFSTSPLSSALCELFKFILSNAILKGTLTEVGTGPSKKPFFYSKNQNNKSVLCYFKGGDQAALGWKRDPSAAFFNVQVHRFSASLNG